MDLENLVITKYIYGTTIFIGKMNLSLVIGDIVSFTFQDLITKNYVIALCSKTLNLDQPIYSRVHSSCVTSETLGSIDCDCLVQLNMALKKIIECGGIIFYLIQEGRGCGYIGKSRACMLVQHDPNKYNTFSAYKHLGMKEDYREYSNIKDIINIMEIKPEFILLTNNPQKIEGFKKVGLKIVKSESLISEPNAYNLSYLLSKRKQGHTLKDIPNNLQEITNFIPVKPFNPHPLPNLRRFIYISSYFLPITPINNKILIDSKYIDNGEGFLIGENIVVDRDILPETLKKHIIPFWFKVNVFYDVIGQSDIVILEYKDKNINTDKNIPLIRIHSESLFNRFPIKEAFNKQIYQRSLENILLSGYGMVVLFYHDGRGFGLGNFVLNKTGENNEREGRDYHSVSLLIKHLLGDSNKISLLYSCSKNLRNTISILEDNDLSIVNTNFIGFGDQELGHNLVINRHQNSFELLSTKYNLDIPEFNLENNKILISGIGTSYNHAVYLNYLFENNCEVTDTKHIHLSNLNNMKYIENEKIILFSQGLSSHINRFIEKYPNKDNIILVTSKNTEYDGNRISIKCDREKETLIRIQGPLEIYLTCLLLVETITKKPIISDDDIKILKEIYFKRTSLQIVPDNSFTNNLLNNKKLCIIAAYPYFSYLNNIKMKFVEGAGISDVILISNHELAHGTYQSMCGNDKQYPVIIFTDNLSQISLSGIKSTLGKTSDLWLINSKLNEPLKIIEYEIIINNFIIQIMDRTGYNQINWDGKKTQKYIYDNL